MYIFELIAKLRREKKEKIQRVWEETFRPKKENEACRHVLVPLDSTKKVLACSKCGFVIKREELEKKKHSGENFFN